MHECLFVIYCKGASFLAVLKRSGEYGLPPIHGGSVPLRAHSFSLDIFFLCKLREFAGH